MSSKFKYSQYYNVRRYGSRLCWSTYDEQSATGMALGRDRGFFYRKKYDEPIDYREWIRRGHFGFIPRHPFLVNAYP